MPIITVKTPLNEAIQIETELNKRLVLAIEDGGIDILHRCGGYAKCTTCRVVISDGEPHKMTEAEKSRLSQEETLYGKVRLSCQILCEGDITLEPVMLVSNSDVENAGKRPEDHITPDPVWTTKD